LGGYRIPKVITMEVDSTLEQDIQKGQLEDAKIQEIKQQIKEEKAPGFSVMSRNVMVQEASMCSRSKRNQKM
jgi:hypothetical protein